MVNKSFSPTGSYFYVRYCEECIDHIKAALKDTLYLNFKQGSCNSLYHKLSYSFRTVGGMYISTTEATWKFTNDSRRQFLKEISGTQNNST